MAILCGPRRWWRFFSIVFFVATLSFLGTAVHLHAVSVPFAQPVVKRTKHSVPLSALASAGPAAGVLQSANMTGLNATLLTSLFHPGDKKHGSHPHVRELFGALAVNLLNPHITEVRVLMESIPGSLHACEALPRYIARILNVGPSSLKKLRCTPVPVQPTYADFFRFADSELANRTVLLANTDVVFDSSLGLIDSRALVGPGRRHAYVLSVKPPPEQGEYRRVMGDECQLAMLEPSRNKVRCSVGEIEGGWWGGGSSWDGYVFRTPLSMDLARANLSHHMNIPGSENRAGFALEAEADLMLINPCLHVHASHWHCIGGAMHSRRYGPQRVDDYGKNLRHIIPCWDCKGVRMPAGADVLSALCSLGALQNITNKRLQRVVGVAVAAVSLCCPTIGRCDQEAFYKRWKANHSSLRLCRVATDISCLVSDGARVPHEVYHQPARPRHK